MKLSQYKPFAPGYNPVYTPENADGAFHFGVLKLPFDVPYKNAGDGARAFLLLGGEVRYEWAGGAQTEKRGLWRDEAPGCLIAGPGEAVTITALSDFAEVAQIETAAAGAVESRYRAPDSIEEHRVFESEYEGGANRRIRGVVGKDSVPGFPLAIHEEILMPGRWGGYPATPAEGLTLGYFRFYPDSGFGLIAVGGSAFATEQDAAVLVQPGQTYPYVGAPAHVQYALWMRRK